MNDLVSVIIPCYNAEKWIIRTLESVSRQSHANMEVIIVIDGATDKSELVAASYLKTTTLFHQIYAYKDNKGAAVALEIGRTLANGNFIQYLDSDDVLPPNKIMEQLQTMQDNKADVAYADYIEVHENGQTKPSRYAQKISNNPKVDFLRKFWRPPACFLFSKEITEKIGKWNSSLKIFYDVAYYLAASSNKAIFIHTPNLTVAYQVHADSLSRKKGLVAYFEDYFTLLCTYSLDYVFQNTAKQADGQEEKLFREELIEALRDCAKAFVHKNNNLFHAAVNLIEDINPNYIPQKSLKMRWLSKILGYRKAELLAGFARELLMLKK
ncbi:MAG: glycosyltransferase [Cytophagales bacterium]|nr:MAG: glycosyltransferase [Cytophagales bacterium]